MTIGAWLSSQSDTPVAGVKVVEGDSPPILDLRHQPFYKSDEGKPIILVGIDWLKAKLPVTFTANKLMGVRLHNILFGYESVGSWTIHPGDLK